MIFGSARSAERSCIELKETLLEVRIVDNLYLVTLQVQVYVNAQNMMDAEDEARGHLEEATVERVINVECMDY